MHFPNKTRRLNYKKTRDDTYYADYKKYYDEISDDCQNRCVYCDVLTKEVGGEGMQLDHFRPQKYFPQLASDPTNLVLACAKCNQLKSDWWPEKTGTDMGGKHGFVDPFLNTFRDYFDVNESGIVVGKLPPSKYVIDLLSINRPTRSGIRRARIVISRAITLMDEVERQMDEVLNASQSDIAERLPILRATFTELKIIIKTVLQL